MCAKVDLEIEGRQVYVVLTPSLSDRLNYRAFYSAEDREEHIRFMGYYDIKTYVDVAEYNESTGFRLLSKKAQEVYNGE